jgi:hypothetical protein
MTTGSNVMGTASFKYVPYKPLQAPGAVASPDLWAVEITDGEFVGLKFAYSSWSIDRFTDPISGEEKRKLTFKYDILTESNQEEPVDGDAKLQLQSLMGNVLLSILVELSRIPWPKKESNG